MNPMHPIPAGLLPPGLGGSIQSPGFSFSRVLE